MTERLYQNDAYAANAQSVITEKTTVESGPAVLLEKTIFYPTAGGQLCDKGTINGVNVIDVYEKDEKIFHVLEQELSVDNAECSINWEHRFNNMQQHTGQHILSQCAYELFSAETKSSSLGSESCTIDIDKSSFTLADAARLENEANHQVYKNVPVNILYPDDKTLAELPLRKQPPPGKKVRIVNVENLDYSPCGGTHCKTTGEVGIIKIRRWEKMRGNIRLEFNCGQRALMDFQQKTMVTSKITEQLAVAEADAPETVARLLDDAKLDKRMITELRTSLNAVKAQDLFENADTINGHSIVTAEIDAFSINELKGMSKHLRELGAEIVFLGLSGEKPSFLLTRSDSLDLNLNSVINELRNSFNVKGGGAPSMIQGGLAERGSIVPFLEEAKTILKTFLD